MNYTNFTNFTQPIAESSYSYTSIIIGSVVFISVSLIIIAIKVKCKGGSELFEIINLF